MTTTEICNAGYTALILRLQVVDGSGIPECKREAEAIKAELARRNCAIL